MKISLLSVLLAGLVFSMHPVQAQTNQAEEDQVTAEGSAAGSVQLEDRDLEGREFRGPGREFRPPVRIGGPIHGGPLRGAPFRWAGPRPGFRPGWHWDYNVWHPFWWHAGFVFAPFVWAPEIPLGYWQCTAFNQGGQAFSDIAPDMDQASYGALYQCGGANYQGSACYIPQGYCNPRR